MPQWLDDRPMTPGIVSSHCIGDAWSFCTYDIICDVTLGGSTSSSLAGLYRVNRRMKAISIKMIGSGDLWVNLGSQASREAGLRMAKGEEEVCTESFLEE